MITIEVTFKNITVGSGSGGGSIVIKNSAGTTIATATTSPYVLPDTVVNIQRNGVTQQTTTVPTLQ